MTNASIRRDGARSASHPAADVGSALRGIDLPSVVAAQVAQAAREVPAVAALPADVLRGPFRDALTRATGHVLRALAEIRPHTEAEIRDIATAFAEVMAVWGLVIDDVVATFAHSAQVLWKATTQHAAPEQLRGLLWAGGGALDSAALVEQIAIEAAAYREHHHGPAERAARAALASTDGAPRTSDPTSARTFVALRPDSDVGGQAALAAELRAAGVTAVTSDGHVVGALPPGAPDPGVAVGDVLVVEAVPRPGLLDARRRRLREVLRFALERNRRGRLSDLDLAAERLLAAAPDVADHLRHTLAAVRADPFGTQLLASARAFVDADGDVASTARGLELHRETVRYRLRRIAEVTGLDASGWRARCLLSLALRDLADLTDDSAAAGDPSNVGRRPSAPTGQIAIRRVLERLDRPEIERRLVEDRRAQQPGIAAAMAASGTEAANAAADLEEIVALLGSAPVSRERDLIGPSRRTLEYLRQGASADDIVAIGRSTPRIVWHAVLDEATDDELHHLRFAVGRLILYVEGSQLAIIRAVTPGRRSSVTALLDVLLDPEATEQARVALAVESGMTADSRRRGFVVGPSPAATVSAGRIAMDLRVGDWAALARGGRVVGFAPSDAAEALLDARVPPEAVVALGAPTPVQDLGPEIGRLNRLVDTALADGRTGRLGLEESAIELLLLARPDIAEAFREAIVTPLARRDAARGGTLVTTLRQYVAHDLERGATAAAMHLHPNSLDYRLRLIRQEIGRTFTTVDDVFAVLLGVTADRLLAAST